MIDKEKLGQRYSCFECGVKFYDLNRPKAVCPDCEADQSTAPATDVRSLLENKLIPDDLFDDADSKELSAEDATSDEPLAEADEDDDLGTDTGLEGLTEMEPPDATASS